MEIKVIFLAINELNFDIVKKYLTDDKVKLNSFSYILNNFKFQETFSEEKYEQLEPWIQWPSVHLGKRFSEHKLSKLGEIENYQYKDLFQHIESLGFQVGVISPMNASNNLKNPKYFIPDPWTRTKSDSSSFSMRFTEMLRQTVNDNSAGRITFKSKLVLLESIVKTFNAKRTFYLFILVFKSIIKPWYKSLVLDYLIHLVHRYLMKKTPPNFSYLFLNAAAHLQHHYFFNSKYLNNNIENPAWYINKESDPFYDCLKVYDFILRDYISLIKENSRLIISTGLTQIPYDRVKIYYRLKDHKSFLQRININFKSIQTLMSRDFIVSFDNKKELDAAALILKKLKVGRDGQPLFSLSFSKNNSLFLTLCYYNEIQDEDFLTLDGKFLVPLKQEVVFVAIKNGMHHTKGFNYLSNNIDYSSVKIPIHISEVFKIVLSIFK